MIVCLDVHYFDNAAHSAAVCMERFASTYSSAQYTAVTEDVGEYEAGKFYLRELPPLLKVIEKISEPIEGFVVDGYCHLSSEKTPGLGAHLLAALEDDVWVVGVAKNRFRDSDHAVELMRGGSSRPLFITSIGIDYDSAAERIAEMAGEFRMPKLLKEVDRLARRFEAE